MLLCVLLSVVGLILLISRLKLNAFVALILASLFMGLCAGMPLSAIGRSVQDGVGSILGSVAIVIGLGTVLGKMLAESGGAQVVATTMIGWMGARRLPWAMLAVALVVGLPVFFSVGLVLLVPILLTVTRQAGVPLLALAVPLLAGLSAAHGLVPPHPGPIVAIGILGADVGLTLVYSLIVALPAAIVAGPILGRWLALRLPVRASGELADQFSERREEVAPPGVAVTLATILLPVGLMLLATIVDLSRPVEDPVRQWADFVGHPVVALLAAVLLSFYTFGAARGFSRARIASFVNDCLGPVASVLLVVGAGGGFNRVLIDSGAGQAIAGLAGSSHVPLLVLGWLVAAALRIATGSATVAISTAAGIVAPMAAAAPDVNVELLVLAMGAGSLILSHVNDGGFWLVKEYLNLSVAETLRSWTVMETVLAVVALGSVLVLDLLV